MLMLRRTPSFLAPAAAAAAATMPHCCEEAEVVSPPSPPPPRQQQESMPSPTTTTVKAKTTSSSATSTTATATATAASSSSTSSPASRTTASSPSSSVPSQITTNITADAYRKVCATHSMQLDPKQELAIKKLDRIHDDYRQWVLGPDSSGGGGGGGGIHSQDTTTSTSTFSGLSAMPSLLLSSAKSIFGGGGGGFGGFDRQNGNGNKNGNKTTTNGNGGTIGRLEINAKTGKEELVVDDGTTNSSGANGNKEDGEVYYLGDQTQKRDSLTAAVPGLYLYGSVGCGKTFIMDLFLDQIPIPNARKQRVHFHQWIIDLQRVMHQVEKDRVNRGYRVFESDRQNAYSGQLLATRAALPCSQRSEHEGIDDEHNAAIIAAGVAANHEFLDEVARRLVGDAHVLCFDEIHVANIADAMMIRRIFERLYAAVGIVTVMTSNRPPEGLFKGGLNRAAFSPFISLIREKCIVHNMDSEVDYRRKHASAASATAAAAPSADSKSSRNSSSSRLGSSSMSGSSSTSKSPSSPPSPTPASSASASATNVASAASQTDTAAEQAHDTHNHKANKDSVSSTSPSSSSSPSSTSAEKNVDDALSSEEGGRRRDSETETETEAEEEVQVYLAGITPENRRRFELMYHRALQDESLRLKKIKAKPFAEPKKIDIEEVEAEVVVANEAEIVDKSKDAGGDSATKGEDNRGGENQENKSNESKVSKTAQQQQQQQQQEDGPPMPRSQVLRTFNRDVPVPMAYGRVGRFNFVDLCRGNSSAADYMAIATVYHTLFIDGLPQFDAGDGDVKRRFIMLLDELYQHGVKLVVLAEMPIDEVEKKNPGGVNSAGTYHYMPEMIDERAGKGGQQVVDKSLGIIDFGEDSFQMERCISRLHEMSSPRYYTAAGGGCGDGSAGSGSGSSFDPSSAGSSGSLHRTWGPEIEIRDTSEPFPSPLLHLAGTVASGAGIQQEGTDNRKVPPMTLVSSIEIPIERDEYGRFVEPPPPQLLPQSHAVIQDFYHNAEDPRRRNPFGGRGRLSRTAGEIDLPDGKTYRVTGSGSEQRLVADGKGGSASAASMLASAIGSAERVKELVGEVGGKQKTALPPPPPTTIEVECFDLKNHDQQNKK